jgi:hypothetical protein
MNGFQIARTSIVAVAAAACALASSLLISGCQTKYDRQVAFTAALNNYYSARQDCLFADSIQFPVSANTLNKDQKAQFDALVTAGLLQRQTTQNAVHKHHQSSPEGYALSNIGRLDWTADQAHMGYGNFCIGNPQVNGIQNSTEMAGVTPTRYKVSYRDRVILPAWASEPQVERAFPKVVEDSSGQTSSATLVKSSSGWKVQNVSPPAATPMG